MTSLVDFDIDVSGFEAEFDAKACQAYRPPNQCENQAEWAVWLRHLDLTGAVHPGVPCKSSTVYLCTPHKEEFLKEIQHCINTGGAFCVNCLEQFEGVTLDDLIRVLPL